MNKLILVGMLLLSCNSEKKNPKVNSDKEIEIANSIELKKNEKPYYFKTDSLHIYQKTFKKMFIAQQDDSNDNFYQVLFVNWISEDKIEYKLYYENQLCEGECRGEAINLNSNINTDQYKGSEYSSIKFEDKKDNTIIIIKIDAFEKNKATVGIFDQKYANDCSPYEHVMFEQKL